MKKMASIMLLSLFGSTIMTLPTKQQTTSTNQPLPQRNIENSDKPSVDTETDELSPQQIYKALSTSPSQNDSVLQKKVLEKMRRQLAGNPFYLEQQAKAAVLEGQPEIAALLFKQHDNIAAVVKLETARQVKMKQYLNFATVIGCLFSVTAIGVHVLTKTAAEGFLQKAVLSAMVSGPFIAGGAWTIAHYVI